MQVSSLTWHWIRGAEHSILPSLTVQTEHPSVKSTHDGLSRTNSSIVNTLSGALSSAAAEQEIKQGGSAAPQYGSDETGSKHGKRYLLLKELQLSLSPGIEGRDVALWWRRCHR
ncbi:hypothetical protein AGR2A_Cc110100 [Agrobacterium genomosp. 2 str. CFBP 5494]|uniref:Uncharacterized protein n=1 Tax=Agrobacterium genomosp. 2 str. CFBP 5494 TaxID=1183436 RepID=A0A9W5AY39_9HYPH|nr:hypothetical protein AGR2A_Cc110100 [Agrobacterium genomosp. 2 str. CFBP 5494]